MHIAIGSDHAGFALKELLREELGALGDEVADFGTDSEASCDYPDIAIPTDTVYGLAASLDHPAAVLRLAELKGRDPDQPIAVLIDSAEAVAEQLDDPAALDRVARHWPGALTAIVRMRDGDAWPPLVLGAAADGSKTVGLRAPDDDLARSVIRDCGGALAAPHPVAAGVLRRRQQPHRYARRPAGVGAPVTPR